MASESTNPPDDTLFSDDVETEEDETAVVSNAPREEFVAGNDGDGDDDGALPQDDPKDYGNINDIDSLLQTVLVRRASKASALLRIHLTGITKIVLGDKKETYVFDWQTAEPRVYKGKDDKVIPDCTLSTSSTILVKIARGECNPQIAMLGRQILVEGKASFAVYFFNLIAPTVY